MMRGLALLLESPGDRLALAGPDVVLVERTGQPPLRLGILALESVVLGAAAQTQAGALARLTAAGVPVTLLSATRDAAQTLAHHGASGLAWRRAQFLALESAAHSLAMARGTIAAKLAAQAAALDRLSLPVPRQLEALDRLDAARTTDELRGMEGAGARAYWAAWATRWPAAWRFAGRNRQPPTDPVNALLSLGYTLAQGTVAASLVRRGLDPQVGYLHAAQANRPSLVLDALEPVRPVVDHWVVQAVQDLPLQPDDFTDDPTDGCRLCPAARKRLYPHWFMHGLPAAAQAARAEVRRLMQQLRTLQPSLLGAEQPPGSDEMAGSA